jgi:ferredoxin
MGGVEVDPDTEAAARVPGLFAAGECAGGMHGSNRLGGNSLSDLLVFGRRAGEGAADYVASARRRPPAGGRGAVDAAAAKALAPFSTEGGENPYTIHQELQQVMNDLVGIIRTASEMEAALGKLADLKTRSRSLTVEGHRQFNPGWHLALDLQNMLLVSECIARAALERQESRGGHTRDDFPAMSPTWRQGQPDLLGRRRRRTRRAPAAASDAGRAARPVRPERARQVPHRRRAVRPPRGEALMGYDAKFRVWRGDDTAGALQDFTVAVNEGEVVLDVIHRLQATQTPDLAVRWNCKAGKCGSCSAEINGRPRLLCMTRMSTFTEAETITVTPLRAFPVIRDLVTDVSFNYGRRARSRRSPPRRPRAGRLPHAAGRRRAEPGVPQVHRVLPLPEHLPRHPRPRGEQAGVRRAAVLHPARRARHAPARHPRPQARRSRRSTASASATSPSAAPRSAPSTSRSPTTRSSR